MFRMKNNTLHRRFATKIKCANDNRQVFQCHPPRNTVTLLDVNDAIDATYKLDNNNASQYFYAVGIDLERVRLYFEIVKRFNSLYKK